MAINVLDKNNFKSLIENNHLVVIDFWAEWCKPCLDFSPTFEQAANDNQDIVFGMLNADTSPEIVAYFNVTQIPCVLAIKDQIVIDGIFGEMPIKAFEDHLTMWRNFDTSAINEHFASKKAVL